MADPLYMRCPKCGFRMPRCELRNIKRCPGCSSTSAYVEDYDDPTRHWQAQSAEIAALRVEVERYQATLPEIERLHREVVEEICRQLSAAQRRAERAEAQAQQMDAEREAWKGWCEKAEALLAMAVEFRLDEGRQWSLIRRPYGPECWRLMNGMEWVKEYPTLDAALAAYESRETTDDHTG